MIAHMSQHTQVGKPVPLRPGSTGTAATDRTKDQAMA